MIAIVNSPGTPKFPRDNCLVHDFLELVSLWIRPVGSDLLPPGLGKRVREIDPSDNVCELGKWAVYEPGCPGNVRTQKLIENAGVICVQLDGVVQEKLLRVFNRLRNELGK
jgi:hypothetical protein